MWWHLPTLAGFRPLLPANVLDVVVRSYATVQVGGLAGHGPVRGRKFERLFYRLCHRRGVYLCETAGARTAAGQTSASGVAHEIDGATRAPSCLTHWELKHLGGPVPKNDLLIFNGKSLDFLQGSRRLFAKIPIFRLLLSGSGTRDECRHFAMLWGIMIIEPGRLPLPLLYEAVARGVTSGLSGAECDAVRERVAWACRPLQRVIRELHDWTALPASITKCGPDLQWIAKEVADAQEQIGSTVLDSLDDGFPDWLDEAAAETRGEVMLRGVALMPGPSVLPRRL